MRYWTISINLAFLDSKYNLCLSSKVPLSFINSFVILPIFGLYVFSSWYLLFFIILLSTLTLSSANFWLIRFSWGLKEQCSISSISFLLNIYERLLIAFFPYSIRYTSTGTSLFFLPSAMTLLILLICGLRVNSGSTSLSLSFCAFCLIILR